MIVGVSGSCPKSELGVTAGAGAEAGAIGAAGLGRAIGLFTTGAVAFFAAGFFAAGFAAGPFLRATFFAFLTTLLAFLAGRAFFFTALLFAAARFVLA